MEWPLETLIFVGIEQRLGHRNVPLPAVLNVKALFIIYNKDYVRKSQFFILRQNKIRVGEREMIICLRLIY